MNSIKIKVQKFIISCLQAIVWIMVIFLLVGCKSMQSRDNQNEDDQPENISEYKEKTKLITLSKTQKLKKSKSLQEVLLDKNILKISQEKELISKPLLAEMSTLQHTIMTEQEEILILDEKLEQSMAEFDKMFAVEIMKIEDEKDKISSETNDGIASGSIQEDSDSSSNNQSETASASDGSKSGDAGKSGKEKNGGGVESQVGSYRQPSASKQMMLPGSGPSVDLPTDISNENDDDIIARQIREAATNETNAQLKEKLWDEYRKYKRGN